MDKSSLAKAPTSASDPKSSPTPPPMPASSVASQSPIMNAKKSTGRAGRIVAKTTIAVAAIVGVVAIIVFGIPYFSGMLSKRRIEVGDYSYVFNDDEWEPIIGENGATLILAKKDSDAYGMSILPIEGGTYEMVSSEKKASEVISRLISGIKVQGQYEKSFDDARCIVIDAEYPNAVFFEDSVKAFCENKDKLLFFIQSEGASRDEMNSNLAKSVGIINTAKHI